MDIRQIVSANLRQYRKAKSLNQRELADLIDTTTKTVSDYEVGRTTPSYDTIERIAAALEIPEAALFGVGVSIVPSGPRGNLLHRINATLSRMNEAQLARAAKMLDAFAGS
jgi:transcriptional regulator with XRE-family HTH domain